MEKRKKFSCQKSSLRQIREFLADFIRQEAQPMDEQIAHQILVAVDEVCANLIIHAHGENPLAFIEIAAGMEGEEWVVVEVGDRQLIYNFMDYPEPDVLEIIKARRKGGLGLILVRRIMDRIQIESESTSSRHVCRMYKKVA